jgi:hypothetical protein
MAAALLFPWFRMSAGGMFTAVVTIVNRTVAGNN